MEHYNDKGEHSNCTDCGTPVNFINEKIEYLECGNILDPEFMPFKKRKTKIKKWNCPSCGQSGENYYLME